VTDLRRAGWAVLFSVPVGAGVVLGTAKQARADVFHPLALAAGAVVAVAVFALVYAALRDGETTIEGVGGLGGT
jgi:hypothetical protein